MELAVSQGYDVVKLHLVDYVNSQTVPWVEDLCTLTTKASFNHFSLVCSYKKEQYKNILT